MATSFENFCQPNPIPGYALDSGVVVTQPFAIRAVEEIIQNIYLRLIKIEIMSGRKVTGMYIGKTYIRPRMGIDFDPEMSATWRLSGGINGRYRHHVKQGYGQSGLIVVGVVTRASVPCGYIGTHEDYCLLLEKQLILRFMQSHGNIIATIRRNSSWS